MPSLKLNGLLQKSQVESELILALSTPSLLVEADKMLENINKLHAHVSGLGVSLRPHLKASKSVEIAQALTKDTLGPVTVSTLKEAQIFGCAGFKDILYAVGIAPAKLDRVVALRRTGIDLSIVLDSLVQAQAVVLVCAATGQKIPVLIEIDSDEDRSGVAPNDPILFEIAEVLTTGGAFLKGVMTHAGGSYAFTDFDKQLDAAEQERWAVAHCATELRRKGYECPVVSVGTTLTAAIVQNLDGVNEVRAGVYPFMDMTMVNLGVCRPEDVALSVLSTVIGHQKQRGIIICDAGWTAMSLERDRGGYEFGLVCDTSGKPYPGLIVSRLNQEHGILSIKSQSGHALPDLQVGEMVRILPMYACATATQFPCYQVTRGLEVVDVWDRFSGW